MTCFICKRESRGFGWLDQRYKIGDPKRYAIKFCSIACQKRYGLLKKKTQWGGVMIDATKNERLAMDYARQNMAEYVGHDIGFDKALSAYSLEQVQTLISVIISNYHSKLQSLSDDHLHGEDGGVPF